MRARFYHRWFATGVRVLTILAAIVGYDVATSASASAATCYYATGAAAHALCWLDFTTYSGAGAQNFSYTLADGSTFTGTITNSGTAAAAVDASPLGAAYGFGNTGYTGILGKPIFVSGTQTKVGPITFSNAKITDTQGRVAVNVTIIGADAESTDFADANTGATTAMVWNGSTNIALLQTLAPASGGTSNCTPTNFNTPAAYCIPTGNNNSSDLLATDTITSAQTFGMSATPVNQYGRQAFAFALNTARLTVAKTVVGRVNTSDQFEVELVNGQGTAFATGTTSGTGTTTSATAGAVPGTAYTLKEVATSGTLGNYASTVNCVNAVTSATTLPAANTAATSISITPAVDDQITCTFSNTPLTATVTPVAATSTAGAGVSLTDSFTLKNTSSIAGTFVVAQPTVTSSTGSTQAITGYTFGGTTYTTLSALNAAISAAGTTASNGTITVGVIYTTNQSSSSSTDAVALPASVTSGTGSSATATGTETDTIAASPPSSTTATNCYVATGANQHLICWLDFTGFGGGTETFSLKMPDGSILTGTAAESGAGYAYTMSPAPVVAGVGLGGGDYTGIAGNPVFYQTMQSTQAPVTLSNLKLTDPNGFSVTTVGMAGADAERTGVPTQPEYIYWSTNGASWTNLQLLTATNPTTTNVCTLSALGANVNCMGATGDPINAYLLRTIVNTTASGSPQSLSMASTSIPGSQGFAFGIDLSLLTASKTIASRAATSDQFRMTVTRGTNTGTPTPVGTPVASSTSTGTGTSVSATTPFYVIPNENYIFSESMAAGSASLLSQYVTTYTCTNGQVASGSVGETQVLPAANASGQSVVIVPQPDAEITCLFNNTALVLTNTPVTATASDQPGATVIDNFTLKNTSLIAGTFVVQAPTITVSNGSTITPSAYYLGTTQYATLALLNAALASAGPTAAAGTQQIGVSYVTSTYGTNDTVSVPAVIGSGTSTSAASTATETDTMPAAGAPVTGTQCYVATGANQHLICWFDFTGFTGGSVPFSFKMPDGSTLAGTVTNTGNTTYVMSAAPVVAGVGFGAGDYTGVLGKPVFYQTNQATQSPIVLSNMSLTDPNGFAVSTIGIAGADAERTGVTPNPEDIYWSTAGGAWTNLQLMTATNPTTTNVCTLSALGANVSCAGATGDPINAYLLRTIVNTTAGSAQSLNMSSTTSGGSQGFAFGIDLALLTSTKTIASRVASSDQFTMSVTRATNVASPVAVGTPVASSTSTGTGTSVTATTPFYVIPNENYIFSESMAAGSASPLSQYASTYTCTDAQVASGLVGVTQVLPAANTSGQSVIIVPQPDAEITCAFTNTAVTMTNVPVNATATDPATTSETDSFTLKNTSLLAGTFVVQTPTITPSSGTAPTPTGYTLTVGTATTTYTTLAALNAAIAGMTPTAANGSIVVGVTYTTSAAGVTNDVVSLPATVTSGTGTSAIATASETDTLPANTTLTISKTGTTSIGPGGLITYTVLVSNTGAAPATGASFSDPMPTGITVTGTPSCATTSGAAVCGAVALNTSTQTVTSTVGSFPAGSSVTFTITAKTPITCGNSSNPCAYTNTATASDGAIAPTVTSSLTTNVVAGNGFAKTVADVTQGGTAVTANTAKPQDVLQYVLTFTNTTGQPIYGLVVSDIVPTNTVYYTTNSPVTCVVAQSSGTAPTCAATYTAAGTLVSGTLPTKASGGNPLLPGATVTVTFQVRVN